jgi:Tol biopolymer transport system component
MLHRFLLGAALGSCIWTLPILSGGCGPTSETLIYSLNHQIWKQYENGSGKVLMFQSGERPRWVPGTKSHFAYIQRQPGKADVKLWVAEYTGASPLALTGFEVGSEYSWSADGKWLAVSHTKDGNYEIYKLRIDGTQQVRLTNNFYTDRYPRWRGLPHGDKIAFVSARPIGSKDRIFIMNADGTGEKELLPSGTLTWYDSPAWSSPGTKLALVAYQGPDQNIWFVDVATGNITKVTSSGININPVWYAEDYLFFVTVLGQGEALKRYDVKAKTTKSLATYVNYASAGLLSVNGMYVFASRQSAVPGAAEIHRFRHDSPTATDDNLGPGREPDVW